MIESPTPLNDLVSALVDGTQSGKITWQVADARGNAFIAKRKSGTVLLRGGPPGWASANLRLTVKDRSGRTVDELAEGPTTGALALGASVPLRTLYDAVLRQVEKADSTIRALAQEFRTAKG